MICINEHFFTVDGLIADPGTLEAEIFNTIRHFVTEKVSGTVKETIMQVSSSKKWISKPTLDEDGNPVLNSNGKPILRKSYSVPQDDSTMPCEMPDTPMWSGASVAARKNI